eukprot:3937317-Rhodomonas_salina.1
MVSVPSPWEGGAAMEYCSDSSSSSSRSSSSTTSTSASSSGRSSFSLCSSSSTSTLRDVADDTRSQCAEHCAGRRRRRRALFLLSTFQFLLSAVAFSLTGTPGHVTASFRRQRAQFDRLVSGMTEQLFISSFRMKHGTMQVLYVKIADQLYRNPVQAVHSSGAPIYPVLRLAMTVCYLAGGSYLDCL